MIITVEISEGWLDTYIRRRREFLILLYASGNAALDKISYFSRSGGGGQYLIKFVERKRHIVATARLQYACISLVY